MHLSPDVDIRLVLQQQQDLGFAAEAGCQVQRCEAMLHAQVERKDGVCVYVYVSARVTESDETGYWGRGSVDSELQ